MKMEFDYIIQLTGRFVFTPIIFLLIGIACIPSPACIIFFVAVAASLMIGVLACIDIRSQKQAKGAKQSNENSTL